MIREINIKNFKSIVDLTLDLGQFNVIIGANGCGKTNILEAIAFAAAANMKKLDNEFLINRDLRLTKPELMVNAFEEGAYEMEEGPLKDFSDGAFYVSVGEDGKKNRQIAIAHQPETNTWHNMSAYSNQEDYAFLNSIQGAELDEESLKDNIQALQKNHPEEFARLIELFRPVQSDINAFLIYHPTEKHLKEVKDSPIFPLGIRGEGLLQYLKDKSLQTDYKEMFESINEGLGMLDWFDGVAVPGDLLSNEYKLSIGDKYLRDSMHFFDQRSTNEGFMFLLFYLTLFNSKDTPPFFSIDNIETALNPRLCTELTSRLINTAKERDKQVIMTTHSPFVLDGLDLSDDEVRLFVARRDIDGHTRLERIMYREDRNMPLSELWMSGLIGGLPDNF
ncbi:MAG: AAA family ATPase [Bacteroidales bacterium]|nr:AAA family ATPase [Bacteroidales bacterium]